MALTERDMGELILKNSLLHMACATATTRGKGKFIVRYYWVEGVAIEVRMQRVSRALSREKGGGSGKNMNATQRRARRSKA